MPFDFLNAAGITLLALLGLWIFGKSSTGTPGTEEDNERVNANRKDQTTEK